MLLLRFLCVEIGYVAFIADSQVAILVKFNARSQSSPASFANMDDDDEGVWLMQKYRSMSVFPITTQERHDVLRLAYTVCLYFESIWNMLLAQCSDRPDLAMITYMSDGWARKVWAITKDSVNGISITHAQRVTKEYLLQRAILKVWNGSSFRSALGLVGARPLLDGKAGLEASLTDRLSTASLVAIS